MGIIPEIASNSLLLYSDTQTVFAASRQFFFFFMEVQCHVVTIWTFDQYSWVSQLVLKSSQWTKSTRTKYLYTLVDGKHNLTLLLAVAPLYILRSSKSMLSCKNTCWTDLKGETLLTFLGKYCKFHLLLLKSIHSALLEGIIHCGNILEYVVWFEDCIKSCPEGCGDSKEEFQTCNRGLRKEENLFKT